MKLLRRPIKIAVAAQMLGTSTKSIIQRKDGTQSLTLLKRNNRLYVWDTEVQRMLERDFEVVREAK